MILKDYGLWIKMVFSFKHVNPVNPVKHSPWSSFKPVATTSTLKVFAEASIGMSKGIANGIECSGWQFERRIPVGPG
jgi:hypothetical protein